MRDGLEDHNRTATSKLVRVPRDLLADELLLLGRDHADYGEIRVVEVGSHTAAAISVGADPDSPSNQFKYDPTVRNEDALSVVELGDLSCFAVADAHYGPEASHMLVERLHQRWSSIRLSGPDHLAEVVLSLRDGAAPTTESETTLLAVVYDRSKRTGFGLSIGDSSFVVVSRTGDTRRINDRDMAFVSARDQRRLRRARPFEFVADVGDLLLAFTDGVDECHYRSPETSIQLSHMAETASLAAYEPVVTARLLAQLALDGVDDNPGGEDNIALVVSAA